MLKDIRKLMRQEAKKAETASAPGKDEIREALMNSKDLEDVVIGSVHGPVIPAKFDKHGRIFFPLFKKGNY